MIIKQHSAVDEISDSIVNCMKPLLYVEYCFGLFRYRLNKRASDSIDFRMKIISVAITAIWIIAFFCVFPHDRIVPANAIVLASYLVSLLIMAAYASSTLILVFWQTQYNRKLIEMFVSIDISLHASIDRNVYKMSFRQCKILFTLYLTLCIMCMAIFVYSSNNGISISYLLFPLIFFERKIELFVFCQFLYMLKQRLLLIKNYLSKFTDDPNYEKFGQNNVKRLKIDFIGKICNTNNRLRDLTRVYCKVGKTFILINKIYNYIIIITLATAFIFILVTSWTILYSHKINDYFIRSLTLLFYLFTEFVSIILITYYCENMIIERNKLRSILYKMNHIDLPINMSKQVNVFVKITNIWHLSINVFGMLEVNLNLILKFVSICTSYLIVIIQINRLI
nr:gustatory receptor 23.2 [Papilio machaon]